MVAAGRHHRADDLGGQDLPRLGGVAQARGGVDRQAEVVAVVEGRVAQVQPHPHAERLVGVRVAAVDPLLDGHRAVDRGGHAREDGHHPVAGRLDLAAAGLGQHLAEHREVLHPQLLGGRGTDPGLDARGADQISEERGDRAQRSHPPATLNRP